MTARPSALRSRPREPVVHELPPSVSPTDSSPSTSVFAAPTTGLARPAALPRADGEMRETAEIFCAPRSELWQSVRAAEHHVRASTCRWSERMTESERLSKLRHDLSNPLSALLAETQLLLLNEARIDPRP